MVRPSAPRFLNFGDRFELPVVVQNQTDAPIDVDVVVQARTSSSPTPMTAGRRQRVTVPANDRVEVRFPASADQVGHGALPSRRRRCRRCRIRRGRRRAAGVDAGDDRGVRDLRRDRRSGGAISQPIVAPARRVPAVRRARDHHVVDALQALTDAVLYLVRLSVRVRRQRTPRASWRSPRCATCSPRSTPTDCRPGRARAAHGCRHRRPRRAAERRRRLVVVGAWPRVVAVAVDPVHARAGARAKAGYAVPDATLDARARVLDRHRGATSPATARTKCAVAISAYALHVRTLPATATSPRRPASYEDEASTTCNWTRWRGCGRRSTTGRPAPRSSAGSRTPRPRPRARQLRDQLRRRRLSASPTPIAAPTA